MAKCWDSFDEIVSEVVRRKLTRVARRKQPAGAAVLHPRDWPGLEPTPGTAEAVALRLICQPGGATTGELTRAIYAELKEGWNTKTTDRLRKAGWNIRTNNIPGERQKRYCLVGA